MTRAEKPYVMIKEGNFSGNDMFEGFCIDLLRGIAAQVGFQYSIKLVPDNTYGIFNPETKMWNGIGMNGAESAQEERNKRQLSRTLFYFGCVSIVSITCAFTVFHICTILSLNPLPVLFFSITRSFHRIALARSVQFNN